MCAGVGVPRFHLFAEGAVVRIRAATGGDVPVEFGKDDLYADVAHGVDGGLNASEGDSAIFVVRL